MEAVDQAIAQVSKHKMSFEKKKILRAFWTAHS